MNRRGFFTGMAATALVIAAETTRLGRTARDLLPDMGKTYAEAFWEGADIIAYSRFWPASMLATPERRQAISALIEMNPRPLSGFFVDADQTTDRDTDHSAG